MTFNLVTMEFLIYLYMGFAQVKKCLCLLKLSWFSLITSFKSFCRDAVYVCYNTNTSSQLFYKHLHPCRAPIEIAVLVLLCMKEFENH